ncbi:DUF424 family protein [archaeon]|jgi:hypothetical protein|nr:DUF424 family protein [archaeon]MBT6182436.1 DUF424 family protein [archaeon]MBT6606337.1 DUF424 family protein [archaeon]MBT7251494.1 DUF424 family protein [archaeon]MBT7660759.1 DUF424 family protein [archaeon]
MGEILIKNHKSYREVIAICDAGLLGKKFLEGKRMLDLTSQFFDGEKFSAEEALEKIKFYVREDATFNIIGEDSVSLCLKLGIIVESGVMRVDSVPFALVLA